MTEVELRLATREFLDRVFSGPCFKGQIITPEEYRLALEKIVKSMKFLVNRPSGQRGEGGE